MAVSNIEKTSMSYIRRNIYVDATNGSDSNDGKSQANAVKTLTGIQKCLAEYADQYVLYFYTGTYNFGQYNDLSPNNKLCMFGINIVANQNVIFDADAASTYINNLDVSLEINDGATLTLNKNVRISPIGYVSLSMFKNTELKGSGTLILGGASVASSSATVLMQSSSGTAEIKCKMNMNASSIHIIRSSGTNTISGNISNVGPGIMLLDNGITYSGTVSGIRIQNGTFYPS